jgi:ABC-type antimicrobial peptide transport system permease subunit
MALVRSRGPFDVEGARRAVSAFGREYVLSADTAAARIQRYLAGERTSTLLAVLAAGLGLLLAGAGVHSLLSWKLSQRRREIAVRSALGASSGRIRKIIWGEAAAVSAGGLLVGVPVALGLGRLMVSILTGVSGADAASLCAAALLLSLAAASAAIGPMLRVGRTDPVVALRGD